MESSKPMDTPLAGNWRKEDATSGEVVEAIFNKKLVGSHMYLVNTRLDMCHAVNQLIQAMVRPTKMYWKAIKHVLRYLRGTTQFGLWKQRSVALSLAEAEYMDASQATCEAIWMRKILVGLFGQQMDLAMIYCDSQSCIELSENLVFRNWSKNIDIRYHHLIDCVLRLIMLLDYIPTEEKDADILTKALLRCKFKFHRDRIEVVDNPFLVERGC
eukprot:PITA_25505